jgi:hypothetical protein
MSSRLFSDHLIVFDVPSVTRAIPPGEVLIPASAAAGWSRAPPRVSVSAIRPTAIRR